MSMRTILKAAVIALVAAMASTGLLAQTTTPPPQTFTTTIYFDYTRNVSNDGYLTGTDAAKALDNKFAFRRAYFTYQNKISDYLTFRFRLDADNTGNLTSTSGSKDDKLRPFMKHLYLEWSQEWLQSKINIGMIETLSFKPAEDRWGFRSVAKTLVDGYKDITGVDIRQSSADIGLTWKGTLARPLRFGLGVFNGEGYSHPELNKFKKFEGYLQIVPASGLNIFAYTDYEKQVTTDGSKRNAKTYKIDGYFDMVKNLNITAEWFTFNNDKNFDLVTNADGTKSESHYNVSGWSVFGTYKIVPDKIGVFARYDSYQPKSTLSSKDMSLVILGLDWFAWGSYTRIQPNIWIYNYKDSTKKTDIVASLTFFMSF
jgi:hypothetical protein